MYLLGANGVDTCYVQFITSSAEPNGKPRITVNINNKTTDTVLISVNGNDGTVHMWDEYYYYGFPQKYQSQFSSCGKSWAVNGNTQSTVSDMGSANSVLLVGAYASKVNYSDINGNSWSYGTYVMVDRLAPFSSRGPMVDGRIKPDLTAPGLTIATAQSSYDTSHTETGTNSTGTVYKYTDPSTSKNYYYSEFTGTSASSPAAAGIVALLLQADPSLTPSSLKTALFTTTIKDSYTGLLTSPNNSWGYGKINAYGALKKVLAGLGTYTYTGIQPDCVVYPNPSEGRFMVDYTATAGEAVTLAVYDMTGRMVHNQLWQVSAGTNRTNIDLQKATPGMYVVKLRTKAGSADMKVVVR
jgi:subtilisin family serine protease